ncbi:YceI family protein [Ascidiimonas sp. W6]|uniref:YceI family protein n=1 Tax=Ascidiimonas meishanensis TaxID=3128903 RepID=UPI0030EB34F7
MHILKPIPIFCTLFLFIVGSFSQEKQVSINEAQINFTFISKNVQGTIGDLKSTSMIDLQNFQNSVFKGSVSLESLKTGNFLRDWHLMSKKYFYRQKHPRIYFKSAEIVKKGALYEVKGVLNIKGISKYISMKASVLENQIKLSGLINTADWNINVLKERADNKVEFSIDLVLKDAN